MKFRAFAFDASRRSKFEPSRAIENEFRRALKRIARASGAIVESHIDHAEIRNSEAMKKALAEYSRNLTPWAQNQSKKLLSKISSRLNSEKAYQKNAREMGKMMSKEFSQSEIEIVHQQMLLEQVGLIKSIPIEAGERALLLVQEGLSQGRRADEIASELMKTTEVTESRAKLIARTETARASTALNLVRAKSVGSTHYKWRTAGDHDVRTSHKKMNGKTFSWDDPPTLEDGMTGHPGTFPNCRCYAEPILPKE